MMDMHEARERVNARVDRLEHVERESDNTAELAAVALLCIGTDVSGPELEDELRQTCREALNRMEHAPCECREPPDFNCASPTVLAGMLNRIFWLGWELGRASE